MTNNKTNKNDIEIIAKDYYGQVLDDHINVNYREPQNRQQKRPSGYVEVFIDGKKVGKNNLTLYLGREQIAQRIMNVHNPNIAPTVNEFISWIGLGNGSANASDPFDPIPPVNSDTGLNAEIPINQSSAGYGDLHADGYYYKKKIDLIDFEPDPENDNAWLMVKVQTTFTALDAQDQKINEACLFMAESNDDAYAGPFHAFAKITFSTILKPATRQMSLLWYLFF